MLAQPLNCSDHPQAQLRAASLWGTKKVLGQGCFLTSIQLLSQVLPGLKACSGCILGGKVCVRAQEGQDHAGYLLEWLGGDGGPGHSNSSSRGRLSEVAAMLQCRAQDIVDSESEQTGQGVRTGSQALDFEV